MSRLESKQVLDRQPGKHCTTNELLFIRELPTFKQFISLSCQAFSRQVSAVATVLCTMHADDTPESRLYQPMASFQNIFGPPGLKKDR